MSNVIDQPTAAAARLEVTYVDEFVTTLEIRGTAANTPRVGTLDLVPEGNSTTAFGHAFKRFNRVEIVDGSLSLAVAPTAGTQQVVAAITYADKNNLPGSVSDVAAGNPVAFGGTVLTVNWRDAVGLDSVLKAESARRVIPVACVGVVAVEASANVVVAYLTVRLKVRFSEPSNASTRGSQFAAMI